MEFPLWATIIIVASIIILVGVSFTGRFLWFENEPTPETTLTTQQTTINEPTTQEQMTGEENNIVDYDYFMTEMYPTLSTGEYHTVLLETGILNEDGTFTREGFGQSYNTEDPVELNNLLQQIIKEGFDSQDHQVTTWAGETSQKATKVKRTKYCHCSIKFNVNSYTCVSGSIIVGYGPIKNSFGGLKDFTWGGPTKYTCSTDADCDQNKCDQECKNHVESSNTDTNSMFCGGGKYSGSTTIIGSDKPLCY